MAAKILFGGIIFFLVYGAVPTGILRLLNRIYNKEAKPRTEKKLYLTFDDGPNPKYTEKLLDLLLKYKIKASFFIVTEYAAKNEDIVKRMAKEGHSIGLHSKSHKNQMLQPPYDVINDFKRSIEVFEKLGIKLSTFRPPWGHISLASIYCVKKNRLKIVLWSLIVQDWQSDTNNDIIAGKLLDKAKYEDVICLHDGRGKNDAPLKTIAALDSVLPVWIEKGYEFGRVEELYENKRTYKKYS